MKTVPILQILAYLIRPEDTSDLIPARWSPGCLDIAARLLGMAKSVLWTVVALVLAYGVSLLSDAHPM